MTHQKSAKLGGSLKAKYLHTDVGGPFESKIAGSYITIAGGPL